ncbi:MAG: hypothetical protein JWQ35_2449 [Bacteriovoracaceae bacterium]|nr:hypothetical protein [Bacteriovoracaceae bacterium]
MVFRCILCVLTSMVAMTLMISLANGQGAEPQFPTPENTQSQPLTFAPPAPDAAPSAASAPAQIKSKSKVVYKEKSYYDFEDVLINGNLRAPDGSFIFRKNQSSFSSALNLHRSFIPELKESSSSAR